MGQGAIDAFRMAAHPNPAAQKFGVWLTAELEKRGWGKRTLARKLAGPGASLTKIDHTRRNVTEYAAGRVNPSSEARRNIAKALLVPLRDLPPADEEGD